MKNFILAEILIVAFSIMSCNAQPERKQTASAGSGNDIEVYYFHMTTRCETCRAVEAEAKKNIDLLYPDLVKSGRISFIALNLEEATGKTIGEQFGVNSQTLLIVKGDQKINITNEGFLYAVAKPDKFRDIIKEKVDLLLE